MLVPLSVRPLMTLSVKSWDWYLTQYTLRIVPLHCAACNEGIGDWGIQNGPKEESGSP